ncbi:MAG: hypothetical protein AAGC71_16515, partial [Pseudomonadota bacterium]
VATVPGRSFVDRAIRVTNGCAVRFTGSGVVAQPAQAVATIDIKVDGLDNELRNRWLREWRGQQTIDPERWLQELAAASGRVAVDTDGQLDGAAYSLIGDISLAPATGGTLAVLTAATGTATLVLDAALLRRIAQSGQSVFWLSYLKRDGDRYVLNAELADGALSLNGAAFALTGTN